jgi:hypothetical protein
VSIIQEWLVPKSFTPMMLNTPIDTIMIQFDEPVREETIHCAFMPSMTCVVGAWGGSSLPDSPVFAYIFHDPFPRGVHYTLSVLPGGVTISDVPVAEASFIYVYPYQVVLPVVYR